MPKLKRFSLKCIVKDLKEDFYKQFIVKILSFRLEYIKIEIPINKKNSNEFYSYKELIKICQNIKSVKMENILISKILK